MDTITLCCVLFDPPCKQYPKDDVAMYWEADGKRFVILNGSGQLEVIESIEYLRDMLGTDKEKKP